jgi:hypothetical protein
MRAIVSMAAAVGWPFRGVLSDRKRVVPQPRTYGTMTL